MDGVIVQGIEGVRKKIIAEGAKIAKNQDAATKAGAQVLVPFVKAALPRDPKSSRPGYLRSHVRVYRAGMDVYKVKLTGTLAHLVFGNTKAHAIVPTGMEAAQTHQYVRKAHARMQGPTLAKRAIVVLGHPYARAIRPAHHGAESPLPRVRIEHQAEVRLAAQEVLLHG